MISFISFLVNTFLIFSHESIKYLIFKDYETFLQNIIKKLAFENVLYVKLFQAVSLNNFRLDEKVNNELLKFTDNSPYSSHDIDFDLIRKIVEENDLFGDIYAPINSGMISLVYKMTKYSDGSSVILKMKRKNIKERLDESISNVMWVIKILSFFPLPFLNSIETQKTIKKSIDLIYEQLDFSKEVESMRIVRENCKHMSYIVVPDVYEKITQENENIIIMQYIDGVSIRKVEFDDYDIYSKLIIKFGFASVLNNGFAHGDLHPGNILFIKEGSLDKPVYKLGILDFGVMINIDNSFKNNSISLMLDLFDASPKSNAIKLLFLIIQTKEAIRDLRVEDYDEIVSIFENFISDCVFEKKNMNQVKIYEIICDLNKQLNGKDLAKYGLSLNDNFIKIQLALSMCLGVTLHLSKDNYSDLACEILKEMLHVDIFCDSS